MPPRPPQSTPRAWPRPRWHLWLLWLVVGSLVGVTTMQVQAWLLDRLEREAFELKADGAQTPAAFGAPYRDLPLSVGNRVIQTRLVLAPSASSKGLALMIFHGNGESISDWAQVQARLRSAGVSSMVFDYSGFGNSSGKPTPHAMHEDALAAYGQLRLSLPQGSHICILGHSLGNAVLLDSLADLQPPPRAVVIHSGFTSARAFVVFNGMASTWVANFLPDIWDNTERIAHVRQPVLVMHSDADEVIPMAMGLSLAKAAGAKARFVRIAHLSHDALYQQPQDLEWGPILRFCQS